MARLIGIEFAGAHFPANSRGDRCEAMYEDNDDRERFLDVLGQMTEDLNWVVHAYWLHSVTVRRMPGDGMVRSLQRALAPSRSGSS